MSGEVRRLRLALVGFGTVGRWLARALETHRELIAGRYRTAFSVVGIGTARDGYVHDAGGLDVSRALALAARGGSLQEVGTERWPTAADGLRASEPDVLVEVSGSRAEDGEPGLTHMRDALDRGIAVVTSNKWPVALAGVELAALARARETAFRAESTVMSGTPVLSALCEGLAGATPLELRGVLNATVNFVLGEMATGESYEAALAEAQRAGLAEPDPSADVDGHDAMAKVMVLSALVLGVQLDRDDVERRGISEMTEAELRRARSGGIREVATLRRGNAAAVEARVGPAAVADDDILGRVTGSTNAITCRADPVGSVTIIGPGAGVELAGQGVLSDLLAVARSLRAQTT